MGLGWLLGALCGWLGDLRPTFGTLLGQVADLLRYLDAFGELFGSTLGVSGVALGVLGTCLVYLGSTLWRR